MIKELTHVVVYILDQDRALRFYTEALGFELRTDRTLDGFRWLTVGSKDQPDVSIMLAEPAPPMFSLEDGAAVKALVAKGALNGGFWRLMTWRRPTRSSAAGVSYSSRSPLTDPMRSRRSSATTQAIGSA